MGIDVNEQEFERLLAEKQSKQRDKELINVMVDIFNKVSAIESKIVVNDTNIEINTSGIEEVIGRLQTTITNTQVIPPGIIAIWEAILKKISEKPKKLVVNRSPTGEIKDVDIKY